jgi:membrane fusion protein, adhesin transport system
MSTPNPTDYKPGDRSDNNLRVAVGEFEGDIAQAARNDRPLGWLLLAGLLAGLLISLIVWANYTELEEVASGPARVIPSSREQVLQSLEGGILQEMLVRESDTVEKGQVLARIDPTRAQAAFQEGANRLLALKAQSARLRAESLDTTLTFPPEVEADKDLATTERATYDAKRRSLLESIASFERAKSLTRQELDIAEPLARKGLLSNTEVLKLKRQANEADLQIIERRNRYRAEASAELSKVDAELSALRETVTGRKDQVERTELRAPVKGIVNNIRINTIGGVIQPGAEIMEITPIEDTLLVEARIKPADVAFLRPDLHATIKLSAYDFSVYGGLNGQVVYISPGALKDEDKRNTQADTTYYRVVIRTEGNTLTKAGSAELRVIPGMTATVDILTGHKSVLSYLLRPVLRTQEAFREK